MKDLIKSGVALIPLPIGKKSPTEQDWNVKENTVTKVKDVKKLIAKNVGLAHAYCTPTPTCAIDIDNFIKASAWLSGYKIDLKELATANDAVVIWSGKKNSLKLLYRLPEDVGVLVSKQVHCDNGSMMLEFRCSSRTGKTVQDLIPPSVHPTGSKYRWMGKGDPLVIPTIPQRLLNIWLELKQANSAKKSEKPPAATNHSEVETPRRVARVKDALNYIDPDCSYTSWRDVVWGILSTGWSCAVELAQEWSMSAPQRYEEDAFWILVNSHDHNRDGGYTLGTVIHHARAGGWNG